MREGQRFNWHLRQEADRLDRTDREPVPEQGQVERETDRLRDRLDRTDREPVPEQRKVERRDRQTGIQVRQERQKDSARTGTGRK